ncbi:MAG: tetratricopeptide repeat protein [Paracoccaceae bacterium]|nr:tetratricopeptide repeat protein [Paracoccaceae bacterium]
MQRVRKEKSDSDCKQEYYVITIVRLKVSSATEHLMELTIQQALQQGIAAHKEGKLQEAERLYKAILKSQPLHPDANHNLGVLATSVDKADTALPLFKTAIEANPNIEQFWLSYIDALFKDKQFENAKKALEEAKKKGVAGEKLNFLETGLLGMPPDSEINNLLKQYQAGQLSVAEKLALSLTKRFPKHQFAWKVLGGIFGQTGRKVEALNANKKAVELSPKDVEAHNNLGVTLKVLGRLDEAEESYKKTIALKPDYAEAHYNLGITLKELGRLEDSEESFAQAIALKPDHAEAHSNLGNALQELHKLDEAEASYRQAIAVKPDYAEAHSNLGVMLKARGKLDEAESSYRQAIAAKPDYAEAHSNLGNTLQELGRLDEAEVSLRQAIKLSPNYALAHFNLGKVLYIKDDKNSALKSINKANEISPQSKEFKLLLDIITSKKNVEKSETTNGRKVKLGFNKELTTNPFISKRVVEPKLIADLSEMRSREMDEALNTPVFGNGRCSLDYNMFGEDRPILRTVENDLIGIMKQAVNAEVFVCDSFFNIYGAGAGIPPHTHLSELDKEKNLRLSEQKFSLAYYLSVGDQNCSDPGILKLYDPDEDILPYEGMIVIFPADRRHSAIYNGKTDRVMIGINFYSL